MRGSQYLNPNYRTNATLLFVLGCVFDVIMGFAFLSNIFTKSRVNMENTVFSGILFACSVTVTVFGALRSRRWDRARQYARALEALPMNLEILADRLGISKSAAAEELNRLVSCGAFEGLYVDAHAGRVYSTAAPVQAFPASPAGQASPQSPRHAAQPFPPVYAVMPPVSPLPAVKPVPIVAVVLLCLFFWPVGVYLIVKRAAPPKTPDRGAAANRIFAGSLLLFLGFSMFNIINDVSYQQWFYQILGDYPVLQMDSFFLVYGLLLLIPGIILFIVGIFRFVAAKRYLRYVELAAGQNITNIAQLAQQVSVSPDKACRDLQTMLYRGYFRGSHLDLGTGNLVFPVYGAPVSPVQAVPPAWGYGPSSRPEAASPGQQPPPPAQAAELTCPRCGAKTLAAPESSCFCQKCGLFLR